MKLATITTSGKSFPAVIFDDGYVDICKHLDSAPSSIIELISNWNTHSEQLSALTAENIDAPLDGVKFEAPIARPGKIFCIGLNYRDHCEETGTQVPDEQVWFTKPSTSIHAPFAPVEIPAVSDTLDYEVELVVVIGKKCRNVPAERFEEVVFGYATGNDVSVREWQIATPQWVIGKSFDTTAPFGPYITTADEVDPHALDVKCFINNELRQSSNTEHLVFNIGDMISKLSQAMTLEPGDLIFTGTPGGVGMLWKGKPHYLKEGDLMRCEIEKLGTIESKVIKGSSETIIE